MFWWAILEGSALFAVLIAFVGVPLWLVWAGIARVADLRSRDIARRREPADDGAAPRATRFGLLAKRVVFTLLGTSGALAVLTLVEWLLPRRFSLPGFVGYIHIGLIGFSSLLVVVLALLGVAIVIDMLATRRVAGRDTRIAFGIVGALCLFQTVAYSLLALYSRG